MAGCGSDDDDSNNPGTGGSGNTGNTGNTGGSGNTGNTGNTGGSGNTGNTGNTGGTGGGTGGTGGGADGVDGVDPMGVPGGTTWIYGYSDDVSTHNVTSTAPGTYCLDGTGAQVVNGEDGMPAYGTYYGAGMGVQFATTDEAGVVEMAFDASNLATISFTVTKTTDSTVRASLVDVDVATQTAHEFFTVDAMGNPVDNEGDVTMTVSELSPPSWDTSYMAADLKLNSIKALQFAVPTVVSAETPYNFCVSNIQMLDADGMSILPPEGTGGMGGAGGMAGAGNMGGAAGAGS